MMDLTNPLMRFPRLSCMAKASDEDRVGVVSVGSVYSLAESEIK